MTIAQLAGRWKALPKTIRVLIAAAVLGVAALALALAVAGHPPGIVLFATPLHPDQLAEVEERLASWNVRFVATNDNVLVDGGRRNELLLRLSLVGVPHAHLATTSEALSNVGVLTPQALIDAQTRAGLAGEIEAGLRGIDGVDDARVIVVPAKASEFAEEPSQRASASVRLRVRDAAQLTRESIAGIRAFVAASVPQLEPGRVTIMDDRGIALGDDSLPPDEAAMLQRSLQSALDAAYGPGVAIVRVREEYEAAATSQRDVRRAPLGAQPLASVHRSETFDSAGKRYRKLEESEDRGSETRERVAQLPPGSLKRLSAAVLVDQSRALDLGKVRSVAAATVGFDQARGDSLVVEAVDFQREMPVHSSPLWTVYGALVPLAPALIVCIGLVTCARVAVPPMARVLNALVERAEVERTTKAAAAYPPAHVRTMLEQEPPHAAAAIISALPAATATAVLELYPPHEREAIVAKMQRKHTPLFPDADELLRRHV